MRKPRHLLTALAMLATGTVVGVASQQFASAEISSGDRPVLIPITPCRLADTRPDPRNVGPRLGKITAGETVTFDTRSSATECAGKIPNDALAVSANITALGATTLSFLTIWPDGTRPNAASLNPAAGEPPTPNAVVTKLSSDGMFRIYNDLGETHVVVDINGYYVHHTHNDLYSSGRGGTFSVGSAAFDSNVNGFNIEKTTGVGASAGGAWVTGGAHAGAIPTLVAPISLPDGTTVTSVTGYFSDTTPVAALNIALRCEELDGGYRIVANGDTVANPATGQVTMTITNVNATVDNAQCTYFIAAEAGSWTGVTDGLKIRGVAVTTS